MNDHPASRRLEELAAGEPDAQTQAHVDSCVECAAYVARLQSAAQAFATIDDAERFVRSVEARSKRSWTRAVWTLVPIAAAAMFFLFVRAPPPATPDATTHGERFKGGLQVAAVVERAGRQERMTGEVRAHPGDRMRIEVSLVAEQPVTAGILEKNGTWTLLLAATTLPPGTHYSDQAARFDNAPTEGWVVAGRPDEVELARRTRQFARVAVLPIVPAP